MSPQRQPGLYRYDPSDRYPDSKEYQQAIMNHHRSSDRIIEFLDSLNNRRVSEIREGILQSLSDSAMTYLTWHEMKDNPGFVQKSYENHHNETLRIYATACGIKPKDFKRLMTLSDAYSKSLRAFSHIEADLTKWQGHVRLPSHESVIGYDKAGPQVILDYYDAMSTLNEKGWTLFLLGVAHNSSIAAKSKITVLINNLLGEGISGKNLYRLRTKFIKTADRNGIEPADRVRMVELLDSYIEDIGAWVPLAQKATRYSLAESMTKEYDLPQAVSDALHGKSAAEE